MLNEYYTVIYSVKTIIVYKCIYWINNQIEKIVYDLIQGILNYENIYSFYVLLSYYFESILTNNSFIQVEYVFVVMKVNFFISLSKTKQIVNKYVIDKLNNSFYLS